MIFLNLNRFLRSFRRRGWGVPTVHLVETPRTFRRSTRIFNPLCITLCTTRLLPYSLSVDTPPPYIFQCSDRFLAAVYYIKCFDATFVHFPYVLRCSGEGGGNWVMEYVTQLSAPKTGNVAVICFENLHHATVSGPVYISDSLGYDVLGRPSE